MKTSERLALKRGGKKSALLSGKEKVFLLSMLALPEKHDKELSLQDLADLVTMFHDGKDPPSDSEMIDILYSLEKKGLITSFKK